MSELEDQLEQELLAERFAANRARRNAAAAEYAKARLELLELLKAGLACDSTITSMAEAAGVRREQAHRIMGAEGHKGSPAFALMDNELEGETL